MRVKIKNLEKTDKNSDYYIVFDFFGRDRRSLLNDRVRKQLDVIDLHIGQEINVIKQIKGGKEFYLINKVYT